METPNAPVELVAHDRPTGQRLRWADALRNVWLDVTTPETLEIQVIWPVTPSDVVIQNANTIRRHEEIRLTDILGDVTYSPR